jgi:hypothetical protein
MLPSAQCSHSKSRRRRSLVERVHGAGYVGNDYGAIARRSWCKRALATATMRVRDSGSRTTTSRKGRLISVRHALAVFLLSASALSCSFFPAVHKVPLSFSVHVHNDLGPVVGLKLQVTKFKTEEFLKLTDEQQRTARPEQFVEVIAESVTNASGLAAFNLTTPGNFTFAPNHPASHLDWVGIDVAADATPSSPGGMQLSPDVEPTFELEWPVSSILKTKQLRGNLSDGLMSSRSSPLKRASLSVRELVSYTEVAKMTSTDIGSFQFDRLPRGLYFLQINGSAAKDSDQIRGDVAVYVGADSQRDGFSVATSYSSCGLSYDLEENKGRYAPQACFKGGKPVPCE